MKSTLTFDIYLYDIAENGKKLGCWYFKNEVYKMLSQYPTIRLYYDKDCTKLATVENLY